MLPAQHISVSINCSAKAAHAFVSNGANLPQWAAGLASGVKQDGEDWLADSPMGPIRIRFAKPNDLGVLDHDVLLPDGTVFANPMRVFPNESGCEVVFTLFRRPEMSDEEYAKDAKTIKADLQKLKGILEK